jgi:hypothetical protein
MSDDLNSILASWRYDPAAINARRIAGADGKPKIQLRLDLGLLQMEAAGRPDGRNPHGFPSLLEYYLDLERVQERNAAEAFNLNPADGVELQQEAAQYYYRYIANYALRDLDRVVEDTEHNLDLIDLVDRHTDNDELAWQFMQFFPYVRMMNARARAEAFAERKLFEEAIQSLEDGIADIREFWDAHEEGGAEHHSREIDMLGDLLQNYNKNKPKSRSDLLQEELSRAIAAENYERAAALRDALKSMPPR